ncbi:MAG: hypothetical protein AAF996_04820 [Pseudomonadota bacterium]
MTKSLITAAIFAASAGIAAAQPLPAPPTTKYTAPEAQTCETQTLQVYFPAGQSLLTAASRAMLIDAQTRLEGCIIGAVSIEATAGDARTQNSAEHLARARLATVSSALDQHQLSGVSLDSDIAKVTPAQYSVPHDRKVEVRLSAWSPEIG